jgi:hypothetical protein
VGHLHPIAQHGQDVVGQHRLGPEIERLVYRRPAGQPVADRELIHHLTEGHACAQRRLRVIRPESLHLEEPSARRLDPARNEAERVPHRVERGRLAVGEQHPA